MKEFDNLESFIEHVALATSIDQDWDGQKIKIKDEELEKKIDWKT